MCSRSQVKTSVQTASKSKKRPPTTSSPADDARRWREGATTPRCLQNAATRPRVASPAARPSPSRTGPRDNLSNLRVDQVMKTATSGLGTPRRALRPLLQHVERLAAPAGLARARIHHELIERVRARRDPRGVDRYHFSACDRLEVMGVAGRVDDRCRV